MSEEICAKLLTVPVALDNLHNLSRYVLIYIIRHRQSVITIKIHLHRCVYSLQQAFFVNACKHKAALIQRFWELRRGADAHRRECMADACEEAAFLRQCTRIRYYSKGVHLQAVVIMEAQRLMLNYALVQFKATGARRLRERGWQEYRIGISYFSASL